MKTIKIHNPDLIKKIKFELALKLITVLTVGRCDARKAIKEFKKKCEDTYNKRYVGISNWFNRRFDKIYSLEDYFKSALYDEYVDMIIDIYVNNAKNEIEEMLNQTKLGPLKISEKWLKEIKMEKYIYE